MGRIDISLNLIDTVLTHYASVDPIMDSKPPDYV